MSCYLRAFGTARGTRENKSLSEDAQHSGTQQGCHRILNFRDVTTVWDREPLKRPILQPSLGGEPQAGRIQWHEPAQFQRAQGLQGCRSQGGREQLG